MVVSTLKIHKINIIHKKNMTTLEIDFHNLKLRKNSYKHNMALEIIQGNPVFTVLSGTKRGWQDYTKDVVQILKDLEVRQFP